MICRTVSATQCCCRTCRRSTRVWRQSDCVTWPRQWASTWWDSRITRLAGCIQAISKLARDVGIPAGLRELKVKEEDFDTLATNALKDACGLTNPLKASHEDIVGIFKAAM